jgi:hypothetical protein
METRSYFELLSTGSALGEHCEVWAAVDSIFTRIVEDNGIFIQNFWVQTNIVMVIWLTADKFSLLCVLWGEQNPGAYSVVATPI